MPRKGNLCPKCGAEIHEKNDPKIIRTYFAERELTARVECGKCGEHVFYSGKRVVS